MSAIVEKVTDAVSNTVEDVTNALANTSITGKDDKSNEAVLASAAEGRRLYIGNLAYATTEGELKEFFKDYLVESVSIPKNPRTDRPVGYAFVDMSTPGEAERAMAELSGQEILERKVSVQLARKPEANDKTEGTNGEGTQRRQSTRGRGRSGRGRGGRARGGHSDEHKNEDGGHGTGEAGASDGPTDAEVQHQPLKDVTNEKSTDQDPKSGKPPKAARQAREHRERRERGPPADGIPSKVKVMVANLPYDLSEQKLKELFSAYEASSAKIALRPIAPFMIKKLQARGEARKGRGFGFVTLSSEEMQQKAVAEMNGKEIDGRAIAVKVAIDSPGKTDDTLHGDHEAAADNGPGEAEQQTEATEQAAATVTATA